MHTWRFNHLMVRTTNPIESCMSSLCRRMSGGDSDVGNWNERVYKVRDCAYDREYTVDVSDPSSCYRGHWEKTPCVHVILLLDT